MAIADRLGIVGPPHAETAGRGSLSTALPFQGTLGQDHGESHQQPSPLQISVAVEENQREEGAH